MSPGSYIKVLFVSAFDAPFIRDDMEVLEKKFVLKKQIGSGLVSAAKIFFATLTTDVLFCWFASAYSFVGVLTGRLLKIKTIVVVGGVDAAKDEELGYGIWLNPVKARMAGYVLRNATHVLVVDPSLKTSVISLAGYSGGNISYVPTGYDSDFWKPLGEKENIVLTVAAIDDEVTYRRKGIDLLFDAALRLPNLKFIVVGMSETVRRAKTVPPNAEVVPKIPREELLGYYQRAKVYCQPSRHEGLPNALCEAMLCGCYPVVTGVNGNPTALGDTGTILGGSDPEELTSAILKGLSSHFTEGMRARARIVSVFTRPRRNNELIRLIEAG